MNGVLRKTLMNSSVIKYWWELLTYKIYWKHCGRLRTCLIHFQAYGSQVCWWLSIVQKPVHWWVCNEKAHHLKIHNYPLHSDIDECQTDKDACDANQICMNLPGGFRCDCRLGFTLDPLTNACEDINECQVNNHECSESQRCDNTIGSYRCIRTQSCGTGYTFNMETEKCDGEEEDEEKKLNKLNFTKSIQPNKILLKTIFFSLPFSSSPSDDDECALGTHNCFDPNYECHNTKGERNRRVIPIKRDNFTIRRAFGSLAKQFSHRKAKLHWKFQRLQN